MNSLLAQSPTIALIRKEVLKLTLVSHVSAVPVGRGQREAKEDIGGRRPTGGLDRRGDREDTYRQKSAEYFQRKLNRCGTEEQLRALLVEAEETVQAWCKTPMVMDGQRPASKADPFWKRWVAQTDYSVKKIADLYDVTPQYVSRVRKENQQLDGGE